MLIRQQGYTQCFLLRRRVTKEVREDICILKSLLNLITTAMVSDTPLLIARLLSLGVVSSHGPSMLSGNHAYFDEMETHRITQQSDSIVDISCQRVQLMYSPFQRLLNILHESKMSMKLSRVVAVH